MRLDNIKEGDEVVGVRNVYGSPHLTVHMVERVTPTLIVVGGERFKRRNGRNCDFHGMTSSIRPLDNGARLMLDKQAERQAHRKLADSLKAHQWQSLTLEQLQQVQALLDSFQA